MSNKLYITGRIPIFYATSILTHTVKVSEGLSNTNTKLSLLII